MNPKGVPIFGTPFLIACRRTKKAPRFHKGLLSSTNCYAVIHILEGV
jgi:hypothetical protein